MKKLAEGNKVAVHIDGAGIFNALATYDMQPCAISDCYDTMTLFFTRDCAVPSVLLLSAVLATSPA